MARYTTKIKLSQNGRTLSLMEWSKELGVKYSTLWERVARGWPIEKVLQKKLEKLTAPSLDEMKIYFNSKGCELLSEYINNHTQMDFICMCGRKSKVSWARFRLGKRCGCQNQEKNCKIPLDRAADDFTEDQKSIIEGSILGDGYLSPRSHMTKSQCVKHAEYIKWHEEMLKPWPSYIKTKTKEIKGKKYEAIILNTKCHPYYLLMRKKWYDGKTKIVPTDLVLNPLSFAIWFFDDGSNDLNGRTCYLHTNCFQKHECEFLCKIIKRDLGLNFTIRPKKSKGGKKYILASKAKDYKKIVDLIKPYMLWDCFLHKIAYREPTVKRMSKTEAKLIRKDFENGATRKELVAKYKYCLSAICNVLNEHSNAEREGKKSNFKNVVWDKTVQKWKSYKTIKGKRIHIGFYNEQEKAAEAVKQYCQQMSVVHT